jgi:hypothetical protein
MYVNLSFRRLILGLFVPQTNAPESQSNLIALFSEGVIAFYPEVRAIYAPFCSPPPDFQPIRLRSLWKMRAPCWSNFSTGEYDSQRRARNENALGMSSLLSLTNTQQVLDDYLSILHPY